MKPRVSFTVIISLISLYPVFCQDIHRVKQFADEQAALGNDRIAIKEYQRVLLFDREGAYRDIYLTIASLYDRREDYDRALSYYDMAWNAMTADTIRQEITFRKTLCYFRMDQYLLALSEIYSLPESLSPAMEKRRQVYLGIASFGLDDLEGSMESFSAILDSTGTEAVKAGLLAYEQYREKYDPGRLQLMSIFLPGLGQTYAGKPAAGINSLLLLAAVSTYSYYTILNYSLLDGILVFTSWFYRYYSGGHRKAYELGEQKIAEKKEQTYKNLLTILSSAPLE